MSVPFNRVPPTTNTSNVLYTHHSELAFVRTLSQSHQSTIHLVRDRTTQRMLVKKIIVINHDNRMSVYGEIARLLRFRDHPGIVRMYQVFCGDEVLASLCIGMPLVTSVTKCQEDHGLVTFLSEYLELGSLHHLLPHNNHALSLPEPVLAAISIMILITLRYLATNRCVHRNIQPENLLVTTSATGTVAIKLNNFGQAFVIVSRLCTIDTGTILYMSPERIHHEEYDESADVWSFGVMLYNWASHRYPFDSSTNHHRMSPMISANPRSSPMILPSPPPRILTREYYNNYSPLVRAQQDISRMKNVASIDTASNELNDFLGQALQRDPRQRASAAQLLLHPFLNKACSNAELSEYISRV